MPAHPDVAPPAGFPSPGSMKLIPLDAEMALANAEQNKKTFAEVFGE